MSKSKEQLLDALCEHYDIVEGFVRFGLEQSLEMLLKEIEGLRKVEFLPPHKLQNLLDNCQAAASHVHVLTYYTGLEYDLEKSIIYGGFEKIIWQRGV